MYQLTDNPDVVINLDTGAWIPNGGNWQWQAFEDWLAEGNTPEPVPPTPNDVAARTYEAGVQAWMDDTAHGNGYADLLTCISFLGSNDESAAADARAATDWRDKVWPAFYTMVSTWIANDLPTERWPELDAAIGVLPQPADSGWTVRPSGPSFGARYAKASQRAG